MRIRLLGTLLGLQLVSPALDAHQATELYIPVGKSPGVSGRLSEIGQIDAVSPAARTITVGQREVAVHLTALGPGT